MQEAQPRRASVVNGDNKNADAEAKTNVKYVAR